MYSGQSVENTYRHQMELERKMYGLETGHHLREQAPDCGTQQTPDSE